MGDRVSYILTRSVENIVMEGAGDHGRGREQCYTKTGGRSIQTAQRP